MNKVLVTVALVLATASLALGSPQTGTPDPQANKPVSQKTIKDPAEYNAYIAALNEADAVKKAALMEAFVQQYPQSIVKIDALEQAMAAYQASNNPPKVADTAQRILAIDANNVRALAILAFLKRAQGTPEAAKEAQSLAERGLQALPNWSIPEGVSEAEFQTLRKQMSYIFYGAAAFGHLQSKEYAVARDNYLKALQIDATDLQNTFQLALCYLEPDPIDLNGFWYAVKAANLATAGNNAAGAKQILDYAKGKYKKYHGGNDGWDAFAATVAAQTAPPPADQLAKLITKAPTPCELAVKAVHDNKLEDLSFADYEFILQYRDCSPANKDAADKVWAYIQGKQKNGEVKMRMNGVKVIAAGKETMDAALTEDNQTNNKADLHVVFEKPVLKPPAAGAMTDIIGFIKDYTPNPFMFTMEQGEFPAVKPPPRRPTTKGKPAARKTAAKKKSAS